MPGRWRAFIGALFALSICLAGCDGGESSTLGRNGDVANPSARSEQARLIASVPIRCDVGERPDYFVPAHSPSALLGCARLGVSGKRVEFSGNLDRIDRAFHFCINPAYSGRGQPGLFIPAVCKLDPPPSRFQIIYGGQPRQGVRGYEFVIWGTAQAATSDVVARFNSGTARAAVFNVPSNRAPWTFGEPPFVLFVFELPLSAACGSVTVHGDRSEATERIPPRRKLCGRA